MNQKPEVLIVGAGPTGLVLALELARCGLPFRIIDKRKSSGHTSRAMIVIPRVLEHYRKFGLDEDVISAGIKLKKAVYHVNNEPKASIKLGQMGEGQSAYPFMLTYPQDKHEALLIEKLKVFSVEVEWETECLSVSENEEGAEVVMKKGNAAHTEAFSYVIGCDGASSAVRKEAGIGFEGETYEQVFFVLDAQAEGKPIRSDSVSFSFSGEQFALFFPLRNKETTRIIGMLPPGSAEKDEIRYESIRPELEETQQIKLTDMNWFSSHKVHRRVAENFRSRRVFLAGDAAHIHSPVGGQGMNAGIGDAVNLGWKLASVLQSRADSSLLETYEPERKEFAEWLVSSTDAVFKQLSSPGRWNRLVRERLIPVGARTANSSEWLRGRFYRLLSQLYVSYETSELSEGKAGRIKAGDRLPYIKGEQNEFVREKSWQLHLFRKASEAMKGAAEEAGARLIERKLTEEGKQAHFQKDAAYFVRLDGHIGWVGSADELDSLRAYIQKWKIL